jgi:hypothetical protein
MPTLFDAIQLGAIVVPILNLLDRLTDGKTVSVAMIDAPQALSLRREPRANVARYDTLRDKEIRHAS